MIAELRLPARDQAVRLGEGGGERLRLAQRMVDHRVAEEGPVVLGDAAERGAVGEAAVTIALVSDCSRGTNTPE